MPDNYVDVFSGNNVSPSELSYATFTTAVDLHLVWPEFEIDGSSVAAQKVDVNATVAGLKVFLPQANQVAEGRDILVRNIGINPFTVTDFAGNTLTVPTSGQQWLLWVVDNETMPGVWAQVQMGTGTSSASAGSLAGAGLRANVTVLDQNLPASKLIGNYSVTAADRAHVLENTGGVVTYTFDTVPNLGGNGWFTYVINSGTGSVTLLPTGGATIDSNVNKVLAPGESCIVLDDGANLVTLGYGRSLVSTVTGTVVNIAPGGTHTLAATDVAAQVQDYVGALTSNATVEYGGSIGYWFVNNRTTGAFSMLARVNSLDPGVTVAQNSFTILRSNGTNMAVAFTATTGTVTEVDTTSDLTGGPITNSGTLGLSNTGVTAGVYGAQGSYGAPTTRAQVPEVQVDLKGRVTNMGVYTLGLAANYDVGSGAGQLPVLGADALVPPINGGMPTGAILDYMLSTPPAGYIFATGNIGNAASAATNRANADTQNLFVGIWNSYPQSTAPVRNAGTIVARGVDALTDFNAGRTIDVADYRGRVRVGLDNMLIGAAGRVTALTATPDGNTMGATGGQQQIPGSTTTVNVSGAIAGTATGGIVGTTDAENEGFVAAAVSGNGAAQFAHHHNFTTSANLGVSGSFAGSGTVVSALTTMQPFAMCNVIVKL